MLKPNKARQLLEAHDKANSLFASGLSMDSTEVQEALKNYELLNNSLLQGLLLDLALISLEHPLPPRYVTDRSSISRFATYLKRLIGGR